MSKNYKRNSSHKGNQNKRANNKGNDRVSPRNGNNYPDTVASAAAAKKNTHYDDIHSNDITWYNKSVTYSDAVRLPFNRIVGDPIKVSDIAPQVKGNTAVSNLYTHVAPTPGIMRIEYAPTIGIARDANSQVNRCFTSIYGDIYSKTTGAMQFQQADLALLSLGLSSIMANIAMCKRALGISLLFSNENYYYPKTILEAIGILPESIIGRQDEIRMKVNEAISNLNHLKMPAFIDLFKRAYQLPLNIYADEDDIKSQLFAFVPEGYYVYHDIPDTLSDYSHLEYKQFEFASKGRTMTIDVLIDIIYEQLEAWRQSSDLGIISGSIQRAYDDSQLIMLDWMGSDYVTVPVYDKVMNWQINNAVITGGIDPDSMHVLQDPVNNVLKHTPKLSQNMAASGCGRDQFIINSYSGDTSDEFIMESTRLIVHSQFTDDTEMYPSKIDVCGFEIPTQCYVYALVRDGEDELVRGSGFQYDGVLTFSAYSPDLDKLATRLVDTMITTSYVSKFRNAPRMEVIVYVPGEPDDHYYHTGTIGDLYRYTTVDVDGLKGLMTAAYQSIYVPMERTRIN